MRHASGIRDRDWTPESLFALAGLMALGIRLVQGWIFWAGASRRLFYDLHSAHGHLYAVKMNPDAAGYVASKLVHAMPGSLFPGIIEWVVQSGGFLHFMVWFWTLLELIVGVGLILGIGTRLLALASVGLNVSLMLIFGWMGSTCVDEWTMAAAGFSIGAVLTLTGGGSWSLDHWLAQRFPRLGEHRNFRRLCSGPLTLEGTRRWAIALGLVSLLFTGGFYQYLHGAVFSPLQARVSFHQHSLALSDAMAKADGSVDFTAYVDAGPDTGKLYLISAELLNAQGKPIEQWEGQRLGSLPKGAVDNRFSQPWAARFEPTAYGLGGATGAKARITLPGLGRLVGGGYTLRLTDINGKHWQIPVTMQ